MKGQLLSGDFLAGIAMLLLAVGIITQSSEILLRAGGQAAVLSSGDADFVSFASAEGWRQYSVVAQNFCFHYSNGTGNCTGFSCVSGAGSTLVSRRVVACGISACLLEVRLCK